MSTSHSTEPEDTMQHLTSRAASAAVIAGALAGPLFLAAGPAFASHGGGVATSGSCSQRGVFTLKAKHDDAAIEVEYQVDTNRAGQAFHVRLTDNGTVFLDRTVTTTAPSGSFTVNKRTADRAGADVIRARAVSGTNTCGGSVTV
jgi:hypothetical protein